jgi:hypothetical protein
MKSRREMHPAGEATTAVLATGATAVGGFQTGQAIYTAATGNSARTLTR